MRQPHAAQYTSGSVPAGARYPHGSRRLQGHSGARSAILSECGADGRPERLKNSDLARTLRRIAERGRDGFYRGETASLIVAEMKRGKGIVTATDLAGYEPKWREPVGFRYRGHEVVAMPPPSSGGITLALIAGQLEHDELAGLGWHSAQSAHLMAESMRRAFAVRNEVIADPDHVAFDQAELLSPAFADSLRTTIATDHAAKSSEVKGRPAPAESRQTTHFSVTDAAGNAVALTTTINGWYGSAVTVTGAGFLLNNEGATLPPSPARPTCMAWCRARPTPSAQANACCRP